MAVIKKLVAAVLSLALLFPLGLSAFLVRAEENSGEADGTYKDVSQVQQEFLEESAQRNINLPVKMNGVTVRPKEDFLKEPNQDADTVKGEIDNIFSKLLEMNMNTIIVETSLDGQVIYAAGDRPLTEYMSNLDLSIFDPLAYFIQKAHENNCYIFAVYDCAGLTVDGALANPDYINTDVIDIASKNAASFAAAYKVDGVLLDNYYHKTNAYSYGGYLDSGSGIGFDNYMYDSAAALISSVSLSIKKANFDMAIGLLTDEVYQNNDGANGGSDTKAYFQMLSDGHSDIKKYIANKDIDFLCVKAFGSLADPHVPFKEVVSWWGQAVAEAQMPLYFVHANEKVCTNEYGYTAPDQITRQIVTAREVAGYKGSCFHSLSRLVENPQQSTDILLKYLNEESDSSLIFKDLYMTRPAKTNYSTYEKSVVFTGTSDPNFDVFINDEKIEVDPVSGNFSLTYELQTGANTFVLKHKGAEIKYTITSKILVLKDMNPKDQVRGDGGMKVSISATAYSGSTVYATLNGQRIEMQEKQADENEETNKESIYKEYVGTYTLPEGKEKEQNLGRIKVFASYGQFKESIAGGSVIVNELPPPPPPDPEPGDNVPTDDLPSGGGDSNNPPSDFTPVAPPSSNMIQITAAQAETFPTTVLDDFANPVCYPYPKGACDYVNGNMVKYSSGGVTYTYYNLYSGRRVYVKDTTPVSGIDAVNNFITGVDISSNGRYTDVTVSSKYKTSHVTTFPGLQFKNEYEIDNYSPSAVVIEFPYVMSVPGFSVPDNQMFSSASWQQVTEKGIHKYKLTLNFKKAGAFSGIQTYYNSNGSLVLRFNSPPPVQASSNQFGYSLAGTKIVIDPGHGGIDGGSLGFNGINEKHINQAISKKVAQYLREAGAEVVLLNTDAGGKYELEQRVKDAQAANPHIFLSIHQNSAETTSGTGVESYYYTAFSKPLAKAVNDQLFAYYRDTMYANGSNKYNRGNKYGKYYVTRVHQYSAILVEYGFINNRTEFNLLTNEAHQDGLAKATVRGIINYALGMQ